MTLEQIQTDIQNMNRSFFLKDLWNKKEDYLNVTDESVKKSLYYIAGLYLIYIMQGELEKAKELLDGFPEIGFFKYSLEIVYPCITAKEFFDFCEKLFQTDHSTLVITLTAGRPFLLDGFGDFSRLGVFLPKNKEKTIRFLKNLYSYDDVNCLYEVCLAEFYYQKNKCYDAQLLISHAIKSFDTNGDMRLLFVALFNRLMLLIVTNQCPNISGYFKEMRFKLQNPGSIEFMYNMNALEAWISLYSGNYEYMKNWMKTDAPDEYGDFNMLDLFRYMVKLRGYLIQDQHVAIVALVEKLRPYLQKAKRPMDLCLLDYIYAMSLHNQGKKEEAFDALERGLKHARRHGYDRLAVDEGDRMLQLLLDYYNTRGGDDYILYLIEITRKMAIYYPYYLKMPYTNNKKFTEIEKDILLLLEQGKNNEEIAKCYLISVNTVKYHLKKIYSKLGVKTATHAVWHAKLLGIIK